MINWWLYADFFILIYLVLGVLYIDWKAAEKYGKPFDIIFLVLVPWVIWALYAWIISKKGNDDE